MHHYIYTTGGGVGVIVTCNSNILLQCILIVIDSTFENVTVNCYDVFEEIVIDQNCFKSNSNRLTNLRYAISYFLK